jgi:Zn-dependent protease with chaperone function
MTFSSVFFWSMIGISFVSCTALLDQYAWNPDPTIRFVFGTSLLASIGISSIMTLGARRFAYPRLLAAMTAGPYSLSFGGGTFTSLSNEMSLDSAELHEASLGDAFSLVLRGRRIVAVSPKLVKSLSPEEVEAVLAHELSHIKNHDSTAKGLARLARLAFVFDPAVHLVEAAVHRERELLADKTAVRYTKKPLALASALIRVHSFPKSSPPEFGAGLFVGGKRKGLFSLYPDFERRIELLLEMERALNPVAVPVLSQQAVS